MNIKVHMDQKLQEWVQQGWRRPLQEDELAQVEELLLRQPQARTQWETDVALTRCLDRLSPPVVSSNFTARVLLQVRALPAPRPAPWFLPSRWIPSGWVPRLAFGALMACVGMFSMRQYEILHRQHVARDMATVSNLATQVPMDWLRNFDTINKMSKVQVADEGLLNVLETGAL